MSGTLLLADDSITIQKVVELTFAETEHNVVAVGNGRELFRRLSEVKPDVVLCDVVMPDMNGYDICQNLKSDPATLHIPVVLLTGTFEPFDRDRALAAGCDAIVTKPFEARELITIVDDLLKRVRAVAAQPTRGESVPLVEIGVPDGVPSLDYSTTGFDRMVPAPPSAPPAPPENAIELTASSLGDSHPKRMPQVPPELQEPAPSDQAPSAPPASPAAPEAEPAPPAASAASAEPTGESPWIEDAVEAEPLTGHGLEDETHPRPQASTAERFPVGDEEPGFPVEPPAEPAPFVAPLELVPPMAPPRESTDAELHEALAGGMDFAVQSDDALFIAPEPLPTLEEAMGLADPLAGAQASASEEPTTAPVVPLAQVEPEVPAAMAPPPVEAVGAAPALAALSESEIERIARRVLEALPAPVQPPVAAVAPPAAEAEQMSAEQIERIARKVLELASPQIERIAWEIIPDMAEMLVRKRIADLEKSAEEEA